ncbi:head-tail connector protein [Litorimonas sp. WD9-15]|uniref:head-tail connector protein n=1 Tax=Litorimonas sp. WD9-15 TaxID=3418716 RepID=UPI003D079328
MTLTDLSPPPTGPVTLSAAKTFLRVDHDHEDALITDLIDSAARQIEPLICASLITRQQLLTKRVRGGCVYLNRYPVTSVEAVRVEGEDVDYTANLKARPASFRIDVPDGTVCEIGFTAGYGTDPSDIPTPLRQALLLLVAHLYEHREGDIPPLPLMVGALLQPYRGVRL